VAFFLFRKHVECDSRIFLDRKAKMNEQYG
jgi:hypothetical protein